MKQLLKAIMFVAALALVLLSVQLARADWNPNERYVVVTDKPADEAIVSLKKLYTGQLDVLAIDTAISGEVFSKYDKAILYLVDPQKYPQVAFDVIKEYAAKGHSVVTDLGWYVWAKKLKTEEHVEKDTDLVNFNQSIPWMEIVAESDVTSGFPVGSIVPWYGGRQVQEGESKFLVYRQRFIPDLQDGGPVRVLGRSSVKKGALLVEEPVGKGRIVAMDLVSLGEPYWVYGYHLQSMDPEIRKKTLESGHLGTFKNYRIANLNYGNFNKYVFLGNVVNRAIEFGQHENRFRRYTEILKWEEAICAKSRLFQLEREASQKPKWEAINKRRTATAKLMPVRPRWEFGLSPNEPNHFSKDFTYPTYEIFSLTAGDDRHPIILLTQIHGGEFSGVYGQMALADWLSRHADDEYLVMKLNNYCLKVVPVLNPSGYEFDWSSGSGMDETHDLMGDNALEPIPEVRDYYIVMGLDFHEGPCDSSIVILSFDVWGYSSALEERICTEICDMFHNRLLYNNANQLMSRLGRANNVLWRMPRQCFPTQVLCLYDPVVEVNGTSLRYPDRFQSFAAITEEIARLAYCAIFPRKWPYEELKKPAATGTTVRVWRWSPDDASGFRVISFSKKQPSEGKIPVINWERFEVCEETASPGKFYRSPVTGWEHAEGARWGCIHSLGEAAQDLKWTYMTKPTFCDWHNWVDADFFRPLLKKHLVYFDQDHDGFFDTFLLDENNDGSYDRAVFHDRRKESAILMTNLKVMQVKMPPGIEKGLLWQKEESLEGSPVPEAHPMQVGLIRRTGGQGTEYGWKDLFHTGFSALGTSLAKRGAGTLKDLWEEISGKTLAGCGVVVITRLEKELGSGEVDAIKDFVSGGGKVLLTTCTHEAKDLARYNQLLKVFGVEVTPEVISSYVVMSPRDFRYLQTERIEFKDRSGLDLLPPDRRIMVMSYVLKGDGAKSVILLNGKTVGSRVKAGKGEMLVLGSAELVSNESLSDRLNHPLCMDQADYPLPAGNAEVRDRLAGWMTGGLPAWLSFLEAPKPVVAKKKEVEVFGFGEETTYGGHKMITMENKYIKVGIVPKLGGRIVQFISKRNGHDQFVNWDLKRDLMTVDRRDGSVGGGYAESGIFPLAEAECRKEQHDDRLDLVVESKFPDGMVTRRMEIGKESAELKMTTTIKFPSGLKSKGRIGFAMTPNVGGFFRGTGVSQWGSLPELLNDKWAAFRSAGVIIPSKLDCRENGLLGSEKEYFCFCKEDGIVHEEQIDSRFGGSHLGGARRKTLPSMESSPWVIFLDKGHQELLGVRYDPSLFQDGILVVESYHYTFARYLKTDDQPSREFEVTLFTIDGMGVVNAADNGCVLGISQTSSGTMEVAIGSVARLEGARLAVETAGAGQATERQVQESPVPLIGAGMSEKVVLHRPSKDGSLKITLKDAGGNVLLSYSPETDKTVQKEPLE